MDRGRGAKKPHDPETAALRKNIQGLVQEYHATDDATARDDLKSQLRVHLEDVFNRKEVMRKQHMERIKTELEKAQESLDKREANRDEIIDRRLLELTEGDPLKW